MYTARNPQWTKLGKARKPMLGLRANGQRGGLGVGGQQVIRNAFIQTALANGDQHHYGRDVRGMPNSANAMAMNFPSSLKVSPEQKVAKRRAKLDEAHQVARAKWSGGSFRPAPALMGRFPAPPEYPNYGRM